MIYDICYIVLQKSLYHNLHIWQQKEEASSGFSPLQCAALFTFFYFFARALIRKRKLENCKDFLSKDSVTRLVIYDICYCITEMPLPQLIWQQKEEASSGFSPLLCPILLCRNKQLWRQWWTITLRQSQAASHYPIQANLDLRTLDLTFEIRETTFGFRESFPRNLLGCFTEKTNGHFCRFWHEFFLIKCSNVAEKKYSMGNLTIKWNTNEILFLFTKTIKKI